MTAPPDPGPSFCDRFVELFDADFPRIYRYLDRLTGEPELAADLAQEAFVRLYRRGALPDAPGAWLITVALNLLRNERSSRSRRRRLLTLSRGERAHSDPAPSPEQAAEAEDSRRRVRLAVDQLPERERRLLLLQAEGYSYGDLAAALQLNPASVGTLLARAREQFRALYEERLDAP
ncbi:MAG TPA: sigma-70 family RNA polymerase sigma factor [Gemmatimonadales bacterium]|jgi:RNA polymerase sigma-70 factor (ECF subfamily)|nr:sigma-70 family RNA polymerase sigma factor [Gemmatimonadales bacterium]